MLLAMPMWRRCLPAGMTRCWRTRATCGMCLSRLSPQTSTRTWTCECACLCRRCRRVLDGAALRVPHVRLYRAECIRRAAPNRHCGRSVCYMFAAGSCGACWWISSWPTWRSPAASHPALAQVCLVQQRLKPDPTDCPCYVETKEAPPKESPGGTMAGNAPFGQGVRHPADAPDPRIGQYRGARMPGWVEFVDWWVGSGSG